MPKSKTKEQTLEIARFFDAPRSLVFKALTEPQRMKKWWGPKGFTCPACQIDLRAGGSYLNCMRSPDGQNFWSKGTYRQITQPEHILCTDSFADENGNTVSPQQYGMTPDWPEEALIDITFTEQAGQTKLTIRHSPITPGPEADSCRQGWNESLDKLADYLANETKE